MTCLWLEFNDSFLCASLVQELVHTSDQAASYLECWLRLHLHYFMVVRPYPGLRRWFSVYFLSKHEDPSSSSRTHVKSKAWLCICNPSTVGEGLETRGSLGPLATSLAPLSVKDPVLQDTRHFLLAFLHMSSCTLSHTLCTCARAHTHTQSFIMSNFLGEGR